MTRKHFILATAGHVDHGKSALVKALTGTDPDRLPEEKARGITIDLGFAELVLDGPNEQRFHIGIVDVPGHEDFVRNMVAGVGSIDLALLTVAADDGWMPQTEEHLQILIYLGVKRLVVALTKCDLGNTRPLGAEIREQLQQSPFAKSSIVPTSVRTGEGIKDLKNALVSELAILPSSPDIDKPRLFVDRAFILRGIGTVVTGTLTGGQIHRRQTISAQPKSFAARVRSIQSHLRDVEVAHPGMRTAINLHDVKIGSGPGAIQRGDIITIGDLGMAGSTLDVLLEKSARPNRNANGPRPLKSGTPVYIHHGTTRVSAQVTLHDKETLAGGERAIARLRLGSPLFVFLSDRFVLRDASEQNTIAGGIVLDPNAEKTNFHDVAQIQLLKARAAAPHDVDICIQSELARSGFAQAKTLLHKSNFSAEEIAVALLRLQKQGAIVLQKEIAADVDKWRDLNYRAAAQIDAAHSDNPDQRGFELAALRGVLGLQSDDFFEALISDLCENGFVCAGTTMARVSHRPALPPQIQPTAEIIRRELAEKPFDPPSRRTIAHDRDLQQALRFLIEEGAVIEVASDVILSRESFSQMQKAVVTFISSHGAATTSELRQELGTSRRVIIPFLEYLDRAGVTHRIGDSRQLRESARQGAARL